MKQVLILERLPMRAVIAATLLVSPTVASAEFFTGNKVLEYCESNRELVAGFVAGVMDGLQTGDYANVGHRKLICPSEGVTIRQATDLMCQYLKDNPKERDATAASSALFVFYDAWPCND